MKKIHQTFELPVYLDCNGSTPVEPEILQRFEQYVRDPVSWGNCSASHARSARRALAEARQQMAQWVGGSEEGIFFCASATEANNLAIQGLSTSGPPTKHIIATELEHASVRKPCEYLAQQQGFELSLVSPESNGRVSVPAITAQLRPETLLVCCMQVSNETGVVQPVAQLAQALQDSGHPAYLHVDAVQGVAHIDEALFPEASLRHPRIDMLTVSGHKMYGLCGIAALLLKKRNGGIHAGDFPPLQPLIRGGGQQGVKQLEGLHSGSVPLALALSLRDAWQLCESQRALRRKQNEAFGEQFRLLLEPLKPRLNGAAEYVLPHVCNVTLPGIDAESGLLNVRSLFSAGRGAACTHHSHWSNSNVLTVMGLSTEAQNCSLRFSWWHRSPHFWQQNTNSWGEAVIRKLLRLKA